MKIWYFSFHFPLWNIAAIVIFGLVFSSQTKFVPPLVQERIIPIDLGYVFSDNQAFLQCHASTLVRAQDGKIIVAWFGGTYERHSDVGIWLSRGNLKEWSAPTLVAKLRDDPHWNPVLHRSGDGSIVLFFKVGKSIDSWESWFKVSKDDGITWSGAKELVAGDRGGRGPVKNKLLVLSDGTWLAPASVEKNAKWNAFVDRSQDGGLTWKPSAMLKFNHDSISGEGIIQPALWESSPGKVHMLLRSSSGKICRSDSQDNGKTWSAVYKTTLPNPNSGIDLTRLENGTILLAYNPIGENRGARNILTLSISKDNGVTWPIKRNVDTGIPKDEFSYPAIIHFQDTVALTYTWKRKRIAFRTFVIR